MRRCFLCAVIVITALAGSAYAQDRLRSASLPERTMSNPVPAPRPDLFIAAPDTYAPRFDRVNPVAPGSGFFPGVFWPWGPSFGPGYAGYDGSRAAAYGYLQLLMQPASAVVYVDGLYVGSVDDLRAGRKVEAGAHRLEIRAGGYEATSVDVRIDPGQTTIYRTDLKPVTAAPQTPAAAPAAAATARPKTFYVIPGCYAGDRRPDAQRLPRGCVASNVREVPPVLSRVASRSTSR
jgi:hypothetical protein